MKRFRLSTVMLLVIIVALGVALVVQEQRATAHSDRITGPTAPR